MLSLVCAAAVVWGWFGPGLARLPYPFDLEWMEGGILGHVQRVLQGKSIYAEPSPEFVAYIYTPLYYYVSAAFMAVLGYGLFPLRLVSFVAALATAALIARFVWYECRSLQFGILSGAVYLGTCVVNADWFDLARVDSLATLMMLGSAYLVRTARTPSRLALGGALAALCFLCKQSSLVVVPPLALYALLRFRWRGLLVFGLALAIVLGGSTLALQAASRGWYWYYTMDLPANHAFADNDLVQNFWRHELPQRLPIAIGCAALYVFGLPCGRPRAQLGFYLPLAVALVLGSYASRLHAGSHINDLMPAHAAIALTSGLALATWARTDHWYIANRAKIACSLAAAAQLALLWRDPIRILPTSVDLATGWALVQRIRNTPGEVLVPNHPHLAVLAGKPAWGQRMAAIDIYLGRKNLRGVREQLRAAWYDLFSKKRFSMVILDDEGYEFLGELREFYDRKEDLELQPGALMPKSGTDVRPALVFLPKP
jgi:hypothetical protein